MVKLVERTCVVLIFFLDFIVHGLFHTFKDGAGDLLHSQLLKEFSNHEIVRPRIYINGIRYRGSTLELQGGGHVEHFIVQFSAFRKNLTLDVRLNKDLLAQSYIEKHFRDGKEIINKPTGKGRPSCHYHGVVREQEDTVVALSVCKGLRGMISMEEDVIYIEPTSPSLNGKHIVTRHSEMLQKNFTCGFRNEDPNDRHESIFGLPKKPNRLRRAVHWPYDTTKDTRIVELYIANDYQQYVNKGRNLQEVITRTQEIINIVSSLYRPLNIYVALVGIEIWTDYDKSDIEVNADTTMNNFLEYRRLHICPFHKNDNAQLITGSRFTDGVVGKAVKSTICSFQYSGGVNMDHSDFVGPVATTVAHEMGHNFGMQHDTHSCTCADDRCIMAASSGGKNPTKWSSCSKEELSDAYYQGLDYCLRDLPDQLYGTGTCGNGFLETGEECDCGLPHDCDNKCCNATTCQLQPNATCATGACCDLSSCHIMPASTECRQNSGECDLAEYCNGKSEFCPHDVHVQNGKPCNGETGFCFNGACPSHDSQCKKLWGITGKNAHEQCYEYFNTMGRSNGHCGFNWLNKTYKMCNQEDVLCGMLHCDHKNEKLMFWKEALAHVMPEAWITVGDVKYDCIGAILDVGLDMPDPGMTPDGTKCGLNKMCMSQKCRTIQDHDIIQCPDCNGKGQCNTLGQCHCNKGYAPPNCSKSGHGGSLHSGPISISNDLDISQDSAGTVAAIVIVFILLIGGGAVIAFFAFRNWQTIKKFWDGRRPYKYESRYKPSFIHRARRSGPPVSSAPANTARVPARPAPAVPPPTAVVQPKPASVKRPRPQSFRDVPISAPRLESTTKSVEDNTMRSVGPRARPLPPIPAEGELDTRSKPGVTSNKPLPNALPVAEVQPQPHKTDPTPPTRATGEERGTQPRPKRPPPPKRTQSFQDGQTLPPPPSYPPPRYQDSLKYPHKSSAAGDEETDNSRTSNKHAKQRASWQPPSQKLSTAQLYGDVLNQQSSTSNPTKGTEKNRGEPAVTFSSLKNRFENESPDGTSTATKPRIQRSISMKGIKPPPPPKPSLDKADSSDC